MTNLTDAPEIVQPQTIGKEQKMLVTTKELRRPSINSRPRAQNSVIFSSDTLNKRKKKSGLKTLLVSGVGFLADAYDLFVIDFVVAILSITAHEEPTMGDKSLLVSATLAGAVIGQLGDLTVSGS